MNFKILIQLFPKSQWFLLFVPPHENWPKKVAIQDEEPGVESFDSGYHSSSGYQFMYEFTEIGSTEYVCDPHPNSMFGSITVSE